MRREHRDLFDVLCRVKVKGVYEREGRKYNMRSPVISLGEDGKTHRVAFNNADRASMEGHSLSVEELRAFYRAYYEFHRIAHNSCIKFLLRPGYLLFFDNQRTLHGRLPYSGPRVMCGAYIGSDEYYSELHTSASRRTVQ
jgi:alpha-ketoglutarate-dependent taurine dioxygenase